MLHATLDDFLVHLQLVLDAMLDACAFALAHVLDATLDALLLHLQLILDAMPDRNLSRLTAESVRST